jgi:hypothetical protein
VTAAGAKAAMAINVDLLAEDLSDAVNAYRSRSAAAASAR